MNSPEETNTGPVIRDLRRIDPATGQVKDPGQGQRGKRPGKHAASKPGGSPGNSPGSGAHRTPQPAAPEAPPAGGRAAAPGGTGQGGAGSGAGDGQPAGPSVDRELMDALAERTADLQRITAEYANYRKRVERDRVAVREQALANVLQSLLPVLDDIGRARQHEELTGGFKSVAESLEAIAAKLGLDSFGEAGEPFDPNIHEALLHSYSPDVTEPTCVEILQPGYRVGERILRPARVAVAEPDDAGGMSSGPPGAPAEHD